MIDKDNLLSYVTNLRIHYDKSFPIMSTYITVNAGRHYITVLDCVIDAINSGNFDIKEKVCVG